MPRFYRSPSTKNTTNGFCECGCGEPTQPNVTGSKRTGQTIGEPRRFVKGHGSVGLRIPKGVRTTPYFTVSGKREHVAVAERALGRALPKGAQVHHVDGDGLNNAHSNLVICQNLSYHKLLHKRQHVLATGGNPNTDHWCSSCQRPVGQMFFYRRSTGRLVSNCIPCCRAR